MFRLKLTYFIILKLNDAIDGLSLSTKIQLDSARSKNAQLQSQIEELQGNLSNETHNNKSLHSKVISLKKIKWFLY